jgi:hypothetical protein
LTDELPGGKLIGGQWTKEADELFSVWLMADDQKWAKLLVIAKNCQARCTKHR